MKNMLDSIFFARLFVSERKQIAFMTEDGPIVSRRIVHEYDDMGNQLKEITYVNSKYYGASTSDEYFISDACEWTYNDSGDLIKLMKYDQWDSTEEKDISFWQEYTYDDSHNVIKEIDYNENGFVSRWRISEYDENGYLTEYTVYDYGVISQQIEYVTIILK